MEQNRIPVDPPGELIKEELIARDWSQRDLAFILGMTEQQLSPILTGKRAITPDMARLLGDAFDVGAEFFANLQKQYDLSRARAPDPGVRTRAMFQTKYPLREMIRRGWIKDCDHSLLELQVLRFFEANDISDVPKFGGDANTMDGIGEPMKPNIPDDMVKRAKKVFLDNYTSGTPTDDAMRAALAEAVMAANDKIDGLEADLVSAIDVLWRRGDDRAREWVKMNYPRFSPSRS